MEYRFDVCIPTEERTITTGSCVPSVKHGMRAHLLHSTGIAEFTTRSLPHAWEPFSAIMGESLARNTLGIAHMRGVASNDGFSIASSEGGDEKEKAWSFNVIPDDCLHVRIEGNVT